MTLWAHGIVHEKMKWPEGKSDEVFYFTENVVHKIGLPIPTTQRANTFTFDQDIQNVITVQ